MFLVACKNGAFALMFKIWSVSRLWIGRPNGLRVGDVPRGTIRDCAYTLLRVEKFFFGHGFIIYDFFLLVIRYLVAEFLSNAPKEIYIGFESVYLNSFFGITKW